MGELSQRVRPIELVVAIWKRRKWLAILAFALPFSAVVGTVPFLPDVYQASAVVVVDRQQVPESFIRSTVTSGLETRIHTISQEVLSRSRLADLITKLDLYRELRKSAPIEDAVGRMRKDIEVVFRGVESRAARGGAIVAFRVNYLAQDPMTAARVANALASFYPEENSKVRERLTADTTEFLARELKEVKDRLEEQEQVVTEFRSRHLGQTPEHRQANLAILDRISTQLRINRDNQSRAMERRETVTQQLAAAEANPGESQTEPAAVRLMKMKQELSNLRTAFSDKYPDVILLKARITALEQQLAEGRTGAATGETRTTSDPGIAATPQVLQFRRALGAVEAEIRDLKLEERRLQDQATTYERRLENTPRFEQEFQRVSRDYETTKDLYKTLLKRYEEAQLAEALEQRQKGEQFRVLENATPLPPAAPQRLRLFAMGFLLSCALAGGAVVLAEHLDTSFHRVDDLRAIAPVPVLSVPRIVTDADVRRWRLGFGVSAVATGVGVALLFTASYLTATGRVPLLSELATSLLVKV